MDQDDVFTHQVHDVVCLINEWINTTRPNLDQLVPALAVVLGRVIARQAQSEAETADMLSMAGSIASASAIEDQARRSSH
jgi:hypothetical protein